MDEKHGNKRTRDGDFVSDCGLPEVKRIREDLLGFFDESDPDSTSQDLDSVMKSFEEEISAGSSSSSSVVVIDLTSESGDSQPELAHLLEASDDELGLPPKSAENEFPELKGVDSGDSAVLCDNLWGFEEPIPSYDSFGFGNLNSEYVAFDDGLFEYSDPCFEYSDYSWRLGTMPSE